jgi:hypothetical protein
VCAANCIQYLDLGFKYHLEKLKAAAMKQLTLHEVQLPEGDCSEYANIPPGLFEAVKLLR